MNDWENWVEWRLTSEPLPKGSSSQRRLGAVEVLVDMLLKCVPPQKADFAMDQVERGVARGEQASVDNLWLLNAWTDNFQRQMAGLPVELASQRLPDDEADRIARSAVSILALYTMLADPGTYAAIRSIVFGKIIEQPRFQNLTSEQLTTALQIRDPYVMGGANLQNLCLDLLTIITEIGQALEATGHPQS